MTAPRRAAAGLLLCAAAMAAAAGLGQAAPIVPIPCDRAGTAQPSECYLPADPGPAAEAPAKSPAPNGGALLPLPFGTLFARPGADGGAPNPPATALIPPAPPSDGGKPIVPVG
ncbi:MAG: hypothetical protein HOQ24_01660 [Mycobacteriaceae bacterium]|nr:hypothetical protein [Mycobacteriaceae bacterium]